MDDGSRCRPILSFSSPPACPLFPRVRITNSNELQNTSKSSSPSSRLPPLPYVGLTPPVSSLTYSLGSLKSLVSRSELLPLPRFEPPSFPSIPFPFETNESYLKLAAAYLLFDCQVFVSPPPSPSRLRCETFSPSFALYSHR